MGPARARRTAGGRVTSGPAGQPGGVTFVNFYPRTYFSFKFSGGQSCQCDATRARRLSHSAAGASARRRDRFRQPRPRAGHHLKARPGRPAAAPGRLSAARASPARSLSPDPGIPRARITTFDHSPSHGAIDTLRVTAPLVVRAA